MLNLAKVIAVVATQNPIHARMFYEEVLGLTLMGNEEFALVFDANGIMPFLNNLSFHKANK